MRWSVPCCRGRDVDLPTIFSHLPCRFVYGSTILLPVQGSPHPVLPSPPHWGNSTCPGNIPASPPLQGGGGGFLVSLPFDIREFGDVILQKVGAVASMRGGMRVGTPVGYENPRL